MGRCGSTWFVSFLCYWAADFGNGQQPLTGPYGGALNLDSEFNLATGRKIAATATCGEGIPQPEMYCKLIGANLERGDQQERFGHEKYFILHGQICDYCDPRYPDQAHPAEHAIDGTDKWWQSPPLARGSQFMEVNLTIDLAQEFHVAYLWLRMGNAPRPEVWILEKSTDYGETWQPWQYFADPPSDCSLLFGVEPDAPVTRDDEVVCTSKFSRIVPLENGEIFVSLVNDRPSAQKFFSSMVLQNWTKATNVRLSFRRMKTLMGHSTAVARQDQTVTRRYYYSIRDIHIGGRCVCNGHAAACDIDPSTGRHNCRCTHNTCGTYCDHCCPGFVQKKWKPAFLNSSNECEACNCFGHSTECFYDPEIDAKKLSQDIYGNFEGGGVCRNCRDNTEGTNCDKCRSGFYRPYGKGKADRDACKVCVCDPRFSTGNCQEGTGICECKPNFDGTNCDRCNLGYHSYPDCFPCDCNYNGTLNQVCTVGRGACPCKPNYTGAKCDQCADTFYGFPNCTACDCDTRGSPNSVCNKTSGQCPCENSFGGRRCDQCGDGYYNHPQCTPCDCDPKGTVKEICDKSSGVCVCKPGYSGSRCDKAASGFYNYPEIRKCDCDPFGSLHDVCDVSTGRCPCKNNFSGRACDMCAAGYYKFPECLACNCDTFGTIGSTCDNRGQCQCKRNFVGKTCNQCGEGYYNYPACEGCNCNPAGLVSSFGGCGKIEGQLCECKERVSGRICDQCKPGYWGLDIYNPMACDECACDSVGTVSGLAVCNPRSGACPCKTNVESRQCTKCKDGFYNLDQNNLHGCVPCGCDAGGSVNNICDKNTGQCPCRPRINGRTCSKVLSLHYFPTLHHLKFEAEDGRTKENGPVQYEFKEADFPGYSWRGYAVMSTKQQEIFIPVQIRKPSLYRMVVHYANHANTSAKADIIVSPEVIGELDQKTTVEFTPTGTGKYVSVGDGTAHSTFVLHPGHWDVSIKTSKPVLIDYIVLLPQAYYEATLLQQSSPPPCLHASSANGTQPYCQNYAYPDMDNFVRVDPLDPTISSYYKKNGDNLKPQVDDISRAGVKGVLVDDSQPALTIEAEILPKEPHHLVYSYFTRNPHLADRLNISIQTRNDIVPTQYHGEIYDCPYSHLCRGVVLDSAGKVAVFAPTDGYMKVTLAPDNKDNDAHPNIVLTDVTTVPQNDWHVDYVKPKSSSVQVAGAGQVSEYPLNPADSVLVEAESDLQVSQMRPQIPDLPAKINTIFLYQPNQTIYLRGTTQRPGDHVIMVHYYQPSGAGTQLEAAVQGVESTPAVLETHYCPSASGCRAVLRPSEGRHQDFRLGKDFSVTVKVDGVALFRMVTSETYSTSSAVVVVIEEWSNTDWQEDLLKETYGDNGTEVYLDYLIAVPADKYHPKNLQEAPRDLSAQFIKECGDRYFEMDTKTQGFCRQATFSLVSGFNNEAVHCDCNLDGSTTFQCEELGGQCVCKENVIGRKCARCKSGYWGFPNCKVCSCPFNSVCDPTNGACICPPKVQGERCDICMPRTYGFHQITGCTECRCNSHGTNGSLECDQDTGHCFCKQNVGGNHCDRCDIGYYSFPHCQACHYCDIRGALEDICDQNTGQCLCKENVAGPRCDMCKQSTFLLDQKNPLGCTKCFCFGVTNACHPSTFYRTIIVSQQNWTTSPPLPIGVAPTGLEVAPTAGTTQEVFWVAPEAFLGNRITSYGGKLSYSVAVNADNGTGSISPDVILKGSNMTIVYLHETQPSLGQNHEVEVELVEKNFEHESGNKVSRDQFMQILVHLEELRIKAGYFSNPKLLTLNYASIEGAIPPAAATAVGHTGSDIALKVEECSCPPEYSGSSCESCAPQHYRSKVGPYLGVCMPCDCNNHAERCDPDTGKCINCLHNTTGERCEMCVEGYHGDPRRGTPYDCMICACPVPKESNNFATTCEFARDGLDIYCQCREGYVGERCQYCAPGYYGRPEVEGDYCKPCKCHGHIDPLDPESCDRETGECMRCLNNTSGPQCDTCRQDFYGDPTKGSCQVCDCEAWGTEECNVTDGTCKCFPNVVGLRCDKCAPNHWQFESGKGCVPCNCGLGSKSMQCSLESGQCVCQPGAAGPRCEECAHGFWNYTSSGCQRCACATKYSVGEMCDQKTGHCSCLPGVTGSDCDRCKPRHVLKENYGCLSCEEEYCVVTLLDDFDAMHAQIDVADRDFEKVSASQFTTRRLNRVNETINNLTQAINFMVLENRPQVMSTFDKDLSTVESVADRHTRLANDKKKSAQDALSGADKARDDLLVVWRQLQGARRNATEFTLLMGALENDLRQGPGSKVTEKLVEAEPIHNVLKNRKMDDYRGNATAERERAKGLQDTMKSFQGNFSTIANRTATAQDTVKAFRGKMADLEKHSVNASETVAVVRTKVDAVQRNITDNVNALKELDILIRETLTNSSSKKDVSSLMLTDATAAFDNLDDQNARLKTAKDSLDAEIRKSQMDRREVLPIMSNARGHVLHLEREADTWDSLFKPTRNAAASGRKAANVFDDIVKDVNDAKADLANATAAAVEIGSVTTNVEDNVAVSVASSQALGEQADQSKMDALKLRGTVESNQNSGTGVKDQNLRTEQVVSAVRLSMTQRPTEDVKTTASALKGRATAAGDKAAAAQKRVDDMMAGLAGAPQQLSQSSGSQPAGIAIQEMLVAENAARQVPQDIPEFNRKIDAVTVLAKRNDDSVAELSNRLEELRRKIELTRNLAGRVKVAMQLNRNNSVQLKNPPDLSPRAAAYTHISMYFRTQEADGLLFYLGNEAGSGRRVKRDFTSVTDDYMALQILGGILELVFDLGSGHASIRIPERRVSDNQTYQAIVERVGKTATLTLRYPLPRGDLKTEGTLSQTGSAPGASTVFNLNQNHSAFFVGGVPLSYKFQLPVKMKRFAGQIEDLEFDSEPVGLWNYGNYTYDPTAPAVPRLTASRTQLVESRQVADGGIKFDGTGYAIYNMEGRTDVTRNTFVILEMKTFAKDGLLLLLTGENNDNFLALELQDGHLVLKYNLGSGTVTITSPLRYNDGVVHSLQAERSLRSGQLQVDGQTVAEGQSPGHEDKLEVKKTIYLGGTPGARPQDVSSHGFEGCVISLQFATTAVKLEEIQEAKGNVLGCLETVRRSVTFEAGTPGYLAMPSIGVKDQFQVTLKFKTVEPFGLLFLTASEDNSEVLSLSLQNGSVVMKSDDGQGQVTTVATELNVYWNGDWHYVSAIKERTRLSILIDDFEAVQTTTSRPESIDTSRPLYFGGIPAGLTGTSQAIPKTRHFIGCIGDVVVNEKFQNFAISQDKPGASFASCMVTIKEGLVLPTIPPQPTGPSVPFWQPPVPVESSTPGLIGGATGVGTTSASTTKQAMPVIQSERTVQQIPTTTITVTTVTVPPVVLVPVPVETTEEDDTTIGYTGPVLDRCALPEHPDVGSMSSTALQFGSRPESRQEFSAQPSLYMGNSDFSLEFKTASADGVVLYVDDQKASPIDFLALYMKNGQLVYGFNPGSGAAVARSPSRYDDNQWHTVKFTKRNKVGTLSVDGVEVANSESPGTTEILNTKLPLYLGGVNGNRNTSKNLEGVIVPFNGCLRNLRLNGALLTDASKTVAVGPCSERIEPGAFFAASGGHMALRDKLNVGKSLEISVEIRPRSNNGLIVGIGTTKKRRDYLALQLIDGAVELSFDNGQGIARVNVTLPNKFYICDGVWHTIKAVKDKFVASLSVDEVYANLASGPVGQSSTDTDTPVYLGSLPASIIPDSGLAKNVVKNNYVGCIRNLSLNTTSENFSRGRVFGDVANSCHIA